MPNRSNYFDMNSQELISNYPPIEEYFRSDFAHSIATVQDGEMALLPEGQSIKIKIETIIDFDSATAYLAVLFDQAPPDAAPLEILFQEPFRFMRLPGGREIRLPHGIFYEGHKFSFGNMDADGNQTRLIVKQTDPAGKMEITSDDLSFSRRVFFYCGDKISDELHDELHKSAAKYQIMLSIRDGEYAKIRYEQRRPLAFISHDARDKQFIVKPLAEAFTNRNHLIWYDAYSLKVGDNLRESVERGLQLCHRVVFIITPNFLSNPGWTKTEFEAVFTRELIENQNLMLPIWAGVSKKEVFEYSPTLANRIALIWDGDVDAIAEKLFEQLRGLSPVADSLSGFRRFG